MIDQSKEILKTMSTEVKPSFKIPTGVFEKDTGYTIHMELPGIKRENIEVNVEKNVLTISAKKDKMEAVKSVELTENIDSSHIECTLDLGILNIDLPYKKDHIQKKRKIEIK